MHEALLTHGNTSMISVSRVDVTELEAGQARLIVLGRAHIGCDALLEFWSWDAVVSLGVKAARSSSKDPLPCLVLRGLVPVCLRASTIRRLSQNTARPSFFPRTRQQPFSIDGVGAEKNNRRFTISRKPLQNFEL
jgi:hypothetical protein